jgi:diacylglycerol kinase (ATP)
MHDLCVIYNPAAGKRRAERRLEDVRRAWGDRAVFRPTGSAGHAVELATEAALEGFATVAAAGGDGTVHDVATGLLRSGRGDVRFAVVPIGSANDFAYSLTKITGDMARIDVGRARREDGLEKFFICNLGIGFNGSVTVESRRIGWLQGTALYGLATLRALANSFDRPMFDIHMDGQPNWRTPTLMLAVLLGQREGGFVMAPDAKLDDGLFDFVHVGNLSRFEVLTLLPRLALFGPPRNRAGIRQGQCRSLRITSDAPVNVHVDGEFLCVKEDGMRSFEIDVLPGALAVDVALSRRGGLPLLP